jgi:Transposase DDE domain
VEELFDLFDGFLKDKGYLAMGGQIIDATIVSKQHNSREENGTIKEGETPEDWKSKLAKNRQKDKDARWTKEHERSYFGYKNHIGVDHRHKFVRRLRGERRERARQSKVRRCSRYEQHGFGRVGRQRLSQPGDRGKTRPTRPEEPHSSQSLSQSQTQ